MFRLFKHKCWMTPAGEVSGLYADMLNQNHLLIAGRTGSGKSVVENGVIYTALYKSPDDYQFVFLDTKKVELIRYKDLPHTIAYCDDTDNCCKALKDVCDLMDRRYSVLQKSRLLKWNGANVWVVIDEMADLMLKSKEVRNSIQMIAQIGRACGVHIMCCTQTPIAKVIPTEIKCNIDSRVGLRTRSSQDSRNIIEKNLLETFPEYGLGYYMTPSNEGVYDIPMVSESEINRLIDWWTSKKCEGYR